MGMSDSELAEVDLQPGKTLVKIGELHSTTGMIIKDKYLQNRRANVEGILWNYVAGHGGDVWWVVHQFDDAGTPIEATVSVYGIREFDVVANLETIEPGTDFLK
jgi:hypothetical protein